MYLKIIVRFHFPVVWNFCVLMHVLNSQTANAVYQSAASTPNHAHVHVMGSEMVIVHPAIVQCEELLGFFDAADWTEHSCNSCPASSTFLDQDDAGHDMILNDVLSVDYSACATTRVRRRVLLNNCSAPLRIIHCIYI